MIIIIIISVYPHEYVRGHLETITITHIYEFKFYLVLKLQLTHFLIHEFLKYVMVSHFIYKML